ncbi:hypothetical protein NQ156_06180 [Microbacterium sp. zg.Y625]|uniref:PH-like domain-containing protein n=1 Tax=Microbacterium jiangjiandongii TaxID=3049071 RepID=UPI00214B37D1|nr:MULTISPECIES: hypothetical protein [unclassified Microbacterium]MCR2792651.1 hypothetical protein [Microbacterium sp. zg.Y625]WIM26634.1 hypothetical protein QNO14_06205 [Microbacterium sp. zg-Y625]
MTRETALLIIVAVAIGLLGLVAWGWKRRSRRDAGFAPPVGEIPAGATVIGVFPALYVATTRHGEPLERLAIRGLGFRSKADVTVTDAGVALDLVGQSRLFIDRARINGVAQATVAIDRVVERDGLARLDWQIPTADGDEIVVDSYFRPQETSARALVDALRQIPDSAPTTGDPA